MKTQIDSTGQLLVMSNNVIVASDFHIPLQDDEAIDYMCKYARDNRVKDLIINGDLMNEDAFSKYPRKDKEANWDIEAEESLKVTDLLQMFFDNIAVELTNHDLRAIKATNWILTARNLMRIVFNDYEKTKISFTDHDHIILNSSWRMCHPDKYSSKPCALAEKFGKRYRMNTIMGHLHLLNHYQIGERHFIDGGCMTKMERHQYVQQTTTTFPEWKEGFVHIKDNVPKIIAFSEPVSIRREW